MILAIRTDKPEAELYLYDQATMAGSLTWLAERKLADELLVKIEELLANNKTSLVKLTGLIIFTGQGSFTGLRIGTTIANTLAYSLNIPIVEAEGTEWLKKGLSKLPSAKTGVYIIPSYNAEPNITTPKVLPSS